ncbi:cytochrome c3 family protein [Holophaga foetida]|uniref:cytochrome c3 family protein n=1 Tax=Holophaga foetida TaxID=35839 RepID=UPI0002474D71|nr:cytochrome c3 family protein [Holophaga foetida]
MSRNTRPAIEKTGLALMLLLGIAIPVIGGERKEIPLANRHKDAGIACEDCHGKGPKKAVAAETCLGCHESYPKVAERTARLKPNPHENHLIDLDCDKCHQGHKPQENYCLTCHSEMEFKPSK